MGGGKDLSPLVDVIEPVLKNAVAALNAKDPIEFGKCLTQYAVTLSGFGLEHPDSQNERLLLSRMPGVLGAKGCGALLSDAVVVLMDSHSVRQNDSSLKEVLSVGKNLGLKCVSEKVSYESGLRKES